MLDLLLTFMWQVAFADLLHKHLLQVGKYDPLLYFLSTGLLQGPIIVKS